MKSTSHTICIIPARGGSKRIPKKNIKILAGKPIIGYVIEAAKATNVFDEIMVSTDDEEIAEVAKEYGATVPFLRSSANSNDYATLAEVLVEVLDMYKSSGRNFDEVCCILPTAALIKGDQLNSAYEKMVQENFTSVVPVIKYAYPVQRALMQKNGKLTMRQVEHVNTRSQDLEESYHDSGQFYWVNVDGFLKEKSLFTVNTGYIELKEIEAQDVDTMEDWEMLEFKYHYKIKNR